MRLEPEYVLPRDIVRLLDADLGRPRRRGGHVPSDALVALVLKNVVHTLTVLREPIHLGHSMLHIVPRRNLASCRNGHGERAGASHLTAIAFLRERFLDW